MRWEIREEETARYREHTSVNLGNIYAYEFGKHNEGDRLRRGDIQRRKENHTDRRSSVEEGLEIVRQKGRERDRNSL